MNSEFLKIQRLALVFLVSLSLLFPITGMGQDDGRVSKTFETGEFTELFLEGAFGVQLIQGNSNSVEIRVSDSKAFEYLEITNKQGLLHLHVDRKPFDLSKVTICVSFKTLERLRIYGGILLNTHGFLDLKDMDILMEGGAKVNLQIKARQIELKSKGGVLCELSGIAESLDVRLSGAGHINAGELKTGKVTIHIAGIGTGKVYATEILHAKINGAGKVRYRGNPAVTQTIEGLGSVERE